MKTKALPKWAMERYAVLWNKFKEREFTYLEVSKLLSKDSNNLRRALISQLRINGWLEVELNPKDSRKRIFRLKRPDEAIEGILEK